MQIGGTEGWVRVAYQCAATLGPWTLTRTRERPFQEYKWTARASHVETFWLSQRPLDLSLQIGHRRWVWRAIEMRYEEQSQSLSGRLSGAPEIH